MPNFSFNFSDYLILAFYFVSMFGIGIFIKFFYGKKQSEKNESLESYFLAGRKLTLPLFIATLVTTWYGNLLGVSELAYKGGIVSWITQGIFWYLVYIFFALFLAERIRKSNFFTIPDQLEDFYDKKTAIAAAVINLILLNPATYIMSMGIIFEIIFGMPAWQGILLGTLVPFVYTLRGGFKAVVYTDLIQFVFMFAGLALIFPFAIQKYGWDFLVTNIPADHLNITGEFSWQVVLAWFVIAHWSLVDASFYQRSYAAESPKIAKQGVLLATLFWFVFDFMITLSGIFAFVAIPDLDPKMALPAFAATVLPPIAKGVFFTGLLATVMSTLDSLTFSSAMSVSKDLYQRIFKVQDSRKVIAMNRYAIVLVVALGLIAALNFQSMIKFMYYKGSIGISALLVPMLSGFFLKDRLKPDLAFWSLVLGACGCVFWIILTKTGLVALDVEPLFVGLGFSVLPLLVGKILSLKVDRAP